MNIEQKLREEIEWNLERFRIVKLHKGRRYETAEEFYRNMITKLGREYLKVTGKPYLIDLERFKFLEEER